MTNLHALRLSFRILLQTTVGVDTNIISASVIALLEGFEYGLVEFAPSCSLDLPRALASPENGAAVVASTNLLNLSI
jgi:hypothetical protein